MGYDLSNNASRTLGHLYVDFPLERLPGTNRGPQHGRMVKARGHRTHGHRLKLELRTGLLCLCVSAGLSACDDNSDAQDTGSGTEDSSSEEGDDDGADGRDDGPADDAGDPSSEEDSDEGTDATDSGEASGDGTDETTGESGDDSNADGDEAESTESDSDDGDEESTDSDAGTETDPDTETTGQDDDETSEASGDSDPDTTTTTDDSDTDAETETSTDTGTDTDTDTDAESDSTDTETSTGTETDTSTESGTETSTETTNDDTSETESTDAEGSTTGDGDEDDGTPAVDIELVAIEINQGVAIPVWQDDAEVPVGDRKAPLVADRELLLRASWKRQPGFMPRMIEARLAIVDSAGTKEVLRDTRFVDSEVDLDRLDGSFHWQLTADQVTPDMRYSVGLFELDRAPAGRSAGTRIPETGKVELGVPDDPMEMEIVVVPMVYNGMSPQTSDAVLDSIAEGIYLRNALQHDQVKISWHAPLEVMENNLSHMLDRVTELRQADDVEGHVYYAGVCDSSVAGGGLAWVAGTGNWADQHRASASGIRNTTGTSVVTHEVGHNQGLKHNPGCGAAGPEPTWPYEDDSPITSQGFNLTTGKLYGGKEYHDYMSYCHPSWVSDFSFNKSGLVIRELTAGSYADPPRLSRSLTAHGKVLHGLMDSQGHRQWSLHPGDTPESPLRPEIRARLLLLDGEELVVYGQLLEVSDPDITAVAIDLPVHEDEIFDIEVTVQDQRFATDFPEVRDRFHLRFPDFR